MGFLRSYDAAMGTAKLSARDAGGTERGAAMVDGRWARPTSVYQTVTLSGLPSGKELELRVELLPPNGKQGAEARGGKMKLLQLARKLRR